jgi:acyl-coenzyme A synthetase/AMP-(fatty) acid ligase
MVPRYIEYVEEIPKTPTQRAQRYLLKQRGIGQAFDAYKAGFKPKKPL